MKKVITIIMLLALVNVASAKFSLGPKVNLNFTKTPKISLNNDVSSNFSQIKSEMAPGFDVGVFFRIGGRFHFQPEVMYSYKTIDFIGEAANTDPEKVQYKYQTLDVPLLFGFSIINSNIFKLRAFVGPSLSFNIMKDAKISGNILDNPEEAIDFKNFYLNADLGLGVDIWRFTVDCKWEFACTPGIKIDNIAKGVYFNMFKVGIGFRFF